jgi:transposase
VPPDLPLDHHCPWREAYETLAPVVIALEEKLTVLDELQAEVAALRRQVFGRKSEKMPPVERELRRGTAVDPEATRRRRREAAEARERLLTERVDHEIEPDKRVCPHCGGTELKPVGPGRETATFDYVPGTFIRRVHVQQTLACPCGQYVVTAEPPAKVVDRGRYEPGFIAHLAVTKCADAMPIYRNPSTNDVRKRSCGRLSPVIRAAAGLG